MSGQLVAFEAQLKQCVESFSHGLEVAETAYVAPPNNNNIATSSSAAALPLAHLRSMMAGEVNGATTSNNNMSNSSNNNTTFSDLDLNAQKELLSAGNTSLSAAATKINRNIQVLHDMVSQGRCGVDPAMEANIMENIKRLMAQNMALRSEVVGMYDKTMERYNALKSEFKSHAQQTLQPHNDNDE